MSSIDANNVPGRGLIAWVWRAVRRHRNKVVSLILLGSIAAAAHLLTRDEVYTAETEILLQPRGEAAAQGESEKAQSAQDAIVAEIERESRLIGSSKIVQQVMDDLNLSPRETSWDLRTLVSQWVRIAPAQSEGLPAAEREKSRALQAFRGNLAVERDPQSRVVSINFTSKDPEEAALVANALADAYLEDRIEARQQSLHERADSLRASTNEVKALIQSSGGNVTDRFYQIMLDRYDRAREREEDFEDPARIIERATVPNKPSNFSGLLLFGIVVAGSCAIGIGAASLLEALQPGYASASEVEAELGHQVVSMLPLVQKPKGSKKSAARWQVYEAYGLTEAVRTLVYALLPKRDLHHQQDCKIVAITSSYPDEGKSTVALSLARQASFGGLRTLLIEGDLRKPGLQARLETINPTYGLADLLRSTVDDVYECVVTEPESEVDIMLGFGPAEDSFTLMRSERMAQLLDAIRPHYDLVILDCAPIMAVSETRSLVDLADETVFVVRWKTTERGAAKTAMRDLERMDTKITGIVINQVDLREHLRYADADRLAYQEKYARYVEH